MQISLNLLHEDNIYREINIFSKNDKQRSRMEFLYQEKKKQIK